MSSTFIPWTKNQDLFNEHEDFEIFERNGKFVFYIAYIGRFYCSTLEEAKHKVKEQKKYVKNLLADIERQNQEYYARIAQQQEELLEELHNSRHKEKAEYLTPIEKKALTNRIYNLIEQGKTDAQIMIEIPSLSKIQLSRYRYFYDSKKK